MFITRLPATLVHINNSMTVEHKTQEEEEEEEEDERDEDAENIFYYYLMGCLVIKKLIYKCLGTASV